MCAYPGPRQTLLCSWLGPNVAPNDALRAPSFDVGAATSVVISLLRVTWQRGCCAQRWSGCDHVLGQLFSIRGAAAEAPDSQLNSLSAPVAVLAFLNEEPRYNPVQGKRNPGWTPQREPLSRVRSLLFCLLFGGGGRRSQGGTLSMGCRDAGSVSVEHSGEHRRAPAAGWLVRW